MIIEIFIVLIDYHYYWLFYSIKSQESFCKFAYFASQKWKCPPTVGIPIRGLLVIPAGLLIGFDQGLRAFPEWGV